MSNEWGRENEPDFGGLMLGAVVLIALLLVVTAMLQGCAPKYEYRDFKITTCSEHKLGCGR
jgi:hypothetical protein